jgi:8-amino-3,8-dideoxy-alpha-D-manno-octulosonate transaminase
MRQHEAEKEIYYPGLGGPGSQVIGEEEKKEVMEVLDSRVLARDRFDNVRKYYKVREFEDLFCKEMDCQRALGVLNCTMGLHMAMSALGVGPGDEVLVPAYTFIATASAVVATKAIPILTEVDETLNMDPKDIMKKITGKTKCILPVHMKGAPCRMDEIMDIARQHNLLVVEDVAQACGASYKGKKCGTFGNAGVFSFDYWKIITTGQGGMIVTDEEQTYRTCVHYNDHGHERYRQNEDLGERPLIGLNFRMEEMEGALGLAQLRKLPGMIANMRQNSRKIMEGIKDIELFKFRELADPDGDVGNGVTVIFHKKDMAEKFFRKMVACGVEIEWLQESGWHNYRNWKQLLKKKTINKTGCPFTCPLYGKEVNYYEGMCPQTDDLLSRSLTLNYNHTLHLGNDHIKEVVDKVQETCREIKKGK